MFRNILKIEDQDEVQFAAFNAEPSHRTLPFAVFEPAGDSCLVIGARGPEGRTTLATQLAAPDSPWTRKSKDDKELWRKAAPFDETIMLGMAANEAMIIVALEQRPVAAAADITTITNAAIKPCVEGSLTASPPPTSAFDPAFKVIETANGKKTPEVVLTTLRSQVTGPRSMLMFNSFRDTLFCEYWTSDARQPAADVLSVVVAAIEALPGIKEVKVKPKKADADDNRPPVLKSWRVSRRGAARKATINVSLERERVIVVTVEPATGWLW